jgi:hypothetical protein
MIGKDDEYFERTALCTKSGKPIMHARDRLGLSLDYWEEKRRIGGKQDRKTWSLLVECAPPLPSLAYTPLRVSENWISADIQKANPPDEEIFLAPGNGPVLDWLGPESTMLPSTSAISEISRGYARREVRPSSHRSIQYCRPNISLDEYHT